MCLAGKSFALSGALCCSSPGFACMQDLLDRDLGAERWVEGDGDRVGHNRGDPPPPVSSMGGCVVQPMQCSGPARGVLRTLIRFPMLSLVGGASRPRGMALGHRGHVATRAKLSAVIGPLRIPPQESLCGVHSAIAGQALRRREPCIG